MKPGPLLDEAALLLARRTGPQWRKAADTTLLSWPVEKGIVRGGWGWLQAQIHRSHRQLVPLWRRKAGHRRVLLLDTLLGADGFTLHDLVTASPSVEDLALGAALDDPRLAVILDVLDPRERRVALAWAHWQPNTWAEAAVLAGAPGPAAYGERVRRKLKRLGSEHTRRRTGIGSSRREVGRAGASSLPRCRSSSASWVPPVPCPPFAGLRCGCMPTGAPGSNDVRFPPRPAVEMRRLEHDRSHTARLAR
ncbi:hypothetical protein ACIQI8_42345 [Streptomyces sp. NPDC092369]|uniref:hypothetical protein n=1 Tax=Streptomyces sp. NPDC092369 TaxID=3366015 RepID=UPI0037F402AE